MLNASLLINILVLTPICFLLIIKHKEMIRTFGEDTSARQILLCMYLTLLALSAVLIYVQDLKSATVVLVFQIIYKLLSVLFIRDRKTPVLWFNLAIAIFHSATLLSIYYF